MNGVIVASFRGVAFGVLLAGIITPFAGCGGRTTEPSGERKEGTEEPREVVLGEEALRAAGILSQVVGREAFRPRIEAAGVIRPDAQRSVTVLAPVAGRVVRVLSDVGERVREGQTLAVLESPEVTAALARHRTAAAREESARKAAERATGLLEIKALSAADLEARKAEAEAAGAEEEAARQDLVRLGRDPAQVDSNLRSPSEFSVTAPLAGVVLERAVSPGLLVEREASLFHLADLSRVWAVAEVYEKDLGKVATAGEAEVRADAFPDRVFQGRIVLVEPALDEATRTVRVRVVVENGAGDLRPGLSVRVALPLKGGGGEQGVAIPVEAVQRISGRPVVFVEKAPGRYEPRTVETGREAGGRVEVLRGLRDGERVVVKGAFLLKSELLKGTIEGED